MATTKPVEPGDAVWTLPRYAAAPKLATVDSVESNGVRIKGDRAFPVPFDCLFDTEADAIKGHLARAADEVKRADRELANAKRRLERLQRKYETGTAR
jgi:hypothetical protein